jgi:hypothetical protein
MDAERLSTVSGKFTADLTMVLKSFWFPYAGIATAVILFNLIGVFGPHVLQHDDPVLYFNGLTNVFPDWLFQYSLLSPYFEFAAWKIMAFSPYLARGLYVLVFMVPISFMFYYLLSEKFSLSRITAATASILPQILPSVWQIPSGVNMSYPLRGLFFILAVLLISYRYLDGTGRRSWGWLAAAVVIYIVAIQSMEQTVFIFPAVLVILAGYTRFNRKHLLLLAPLLIISVMRIARMVLIPRITMTKIPVKEIVSRIVRYVNWSIPSLNKNSVLLAIAAVGIAVAGLIVIMKTGDATGTPGTGYRHIKRKYFTLYAYGSFFTWMVSTIIVFIFLSNDYESRYIYISAFGFWVLLCMSLQALLSGLSKKKAIVPMIAFISIILCSGFMRLYALNDFFGLQNRIQKTIAGTVNNRQLPPFSQVVVVGVPHFAGGWLRSSGYLKLATRRNDIEGLVSIENASPYYNYDDHFDPMVRGWEGRFYVTGLDPKRPLFFYKMDSSCLRKKFKNKLKKKCEVMHQMDYVLRWRGELKDAPWTILKFDRVRGKSVPVVSGKGFADYTGALKKLETQGISQSDILWGAPPTDGERKRLGLE